MNMQSISQMLVKRRKAVSASQKEVAELASLSLHSVHNLESGKGNPTLHSFLSLLDVLGLELTLSVKQTPEVEVTND